MIARSYYIYFLYCGFLCSKNIHKTTLRAITQHLKLDEQSATKKKRHNNQEEFCHYLKFRIHFVVVLEMSFKPPASTVPGATQTAQECRQDLAVWDTSLMPFDILLQTVSSATFPTF